MSTPLVSKISFDADKLTAFAPATSDDRYKNSQLTELGPAFMTWEEAGQTDQWVIGFEEALYVIAGELTINAVEDGHAYTVSGTAGDVLTVGKGATVSYTGTAGTRAFVCFSPLNWQDLIA
jgi:ethanolamine utilization protein EutQ (cupin superfamily)